MRRAGASEISSLDLLLDTICNTFGGIVFIALLMALLAQAAGQAARSGATSERRRLESIKKEQQAAELADSIRVLEKQAARLEKMQPAPTNTVTDELAAVVSTNALLQVEASTKERELKARRTELEDKKSKAAALDGKLVQLRRKIKELAVPAMRESAPAVTRRLPRVQKVSPLLRHVWVAIYRGRIHMIDALDATASYPPRIEFDPAVVVHHEAASWIIELPPGSGQPVRSGCEGEGRLAELLRKTSKTQHVIHFMVDMDSFAEFNYVKGLVVERGYRYMFSIQAPPYFFVRGTPDEAM